MIVLWLLFLQILQVIILYQLSCPGRKISLYEQDVTKLSLDICYCLLIGDFTTFRVSRLDVPKETFLPACDVNPMTFTKMLLEVHQQNTCSGFCLTGHYNQNCHSMRIPPNEAVLSVHASSHPCLTLCNWNYELWEEFMKIQRVIFSSRISLKSC